jgi:hypothetical protein
MKVQYSVDGKEWKEYGDLDVAASDIPDANSYKDVDMQLPMLVDNHRGRNTEKENALAVQFEKSRIIQLRGPYDVPGLVLEEVHRLRPWVDVSLTVETPPILDGAPIIIGGFGDCGFLTVLIKQSMLGFGVQCNSGGSDAPLWAYADLKPNSQYHIEVSYDEALKEARIYVDGSLKAKGIKVFNFAAEGAVSVNRGAHEGEAEKFMGTVGDIVISTLTSRCEPQVQALCAGHTKHAVCLNLKQAAKKGAAKQYAMFLNADGTAHIEDSVSEKQYTCQCEGECDGIVGLWNCLDFFDTRITITDNFRDDFTAATSQDSVDVCFDKDKAKSCLPTSTSRDDPGYFDRYRGWFDVQGCGKCNDFCRWVGKSGAGGNPRCQQDYDDSWWSCRMAGTNQTYTKRGNFNEWLFNKCDAEGATAPLKAGCSPSSPNRIDAGWHDDHRGWYDVQGCGKCHDYCRWTGGSGSGGNPTISTVNETTGSYWSCRLAGGNITHTPKGAIAEWKYQRCGIEGADAPKAQRLESSRSVCGGVGAVPDALAQELQTANEEVDKSMRVLSDAAEGINPLDKDVEALRAMPSKAQIPALQNLIDNMKAQIAMTTDEAANKKHRAFLVLMEASRMGQLVVQVLTKKTEAVNDVSFAKADLRTTLADCNKLAMQLRKDTSQSAAILKLKDNAAEVQRIINSIKRMLMHALVVDELEQVNQDVNAAADKLQEKDKAKEAKMLISVSKKIEAVKDAEKDADKAKDDAITLKIQAEEAQEAAAAEAAVAVPPQEQQTAAAASTSDTASSSEDSTEDDAASSEDKKDSTASSGNTPDQERDQHTSNANTPHDAGRSSDVDNASQSDTPPPPPPIDTIDEKSTPPQQQKLCKPKSTSIDDPGWNDNYRGWFDIQACGKCHDFCRWVSGSGSGGNPAVSTVNDAAGSYWSCRLAGGNQTYTTKGQYTTWSYPVCTAEGSNSPAEGSNSQERVIRLHESSDEKSSSDDVINLDDFDSDGSLSVLDTTADFQDSAAQHL